jgi:hypothetical protein
MPLSAEHIAFARLLDAYGADRLRWPATDRLRFARFVAPDDEARRQLAEAEALDRLLDRAEAQGASAFIGGDDERALVDRIVAAATAEGRSAVAAPGDADGAGCYERVTVDASPARTPRAALARALARAETATWRRDAPALALLAASLAAGLMVGLSGLAAPAVATLTAMIGGTLDAEVETVLLDEGDDTNEDRI